MVSLERKHEAEQSLPQVFGSLCSHQRWSLVYHWQLTKLMPLQRNLLCKIRRHDNDGIGHSTVAGSINEFLQNKSVREINTQLLGKTHTK